MSDSGPPDPSSWIGKIVGDPTASGVSQQLFLLALQEITRAIKAQTQAIQSNPPKSYVFSGLPTTPGIGFIVVITDSNTNTWGAAIAGGGGNTVLAWWNGAAWTCIGK